MPNNPAYSARSGGSKFLALANTMCRLVNLSAPTIRARFSDRPALLAVLTAAEAMCALLPAAAAEAADADALTNDQFFPPEGTPIPGQDAD